MNFSDNKIPQHVAIIMDGNGRWAKKNFKSVISGHKKGIEVAQDIIAEATKFKIPFISLYAFSCENWQRDENWVNNFLDLLRWYFKNQIKELVKNDVRLKIIGNKSKFPEDIQELFLYSEDRTKDCNLITVNLALSYGGRDEITRALRKIALKVRDGVIDPEVVDHNLINDHLDTHYLPDPDLLIRTSGETRISNFMLWQLAYTEFVFYDKLWPDFTKQDFDNAIMVFQKRERRYGMYS
jgi:undecaprenyl diphosphate synthase